MLSGFSKPRRGLSSRAVSFIRTAVTRTYYEVLGVPRDATSPEIKAAYYRQARLTHPDSHPNDPSAAAQFAAVAAAYRVLGNSQLRREYDASSYKEKSSSSASSAPSPVGGWVAKVFGEGGYADALGFGPFVRGAMSVLGVEIAPSSPSSQDASTNNNTQNTSGSAHNKLSISIHEALRGCDKRYGNYTVHIPPGTTDGEVLMGTEVSNKKKQVPFVVNVASHPLYHREGDDLHVRLPVNVMDAILGRTLLLPLPTFSTPFHIRIPPGTQSGTVIRIPEAGVRRQGATCRGAALVHVDVIVPRTLSRTGAKDLMKLRLKERSHERQSRWWKEAFGDYEKETERFIKRK